MVLGVREAVDCCRIRRHASGLDFLWLCGLPCSQMKSRLESLNGTDAEIDIEAIVGKPFIVLLGKPDGL